MDSAIAKLRDKIISAFSSVAHPGKEITEHRCEECDQLQDTFRPLFAKTIPAEILDSNFDQLPLFAPAAYRYFLPAFLLRCLDDFDSECMVCEYAIYSLTPEVPDESTARWVAERHTLFDAKQKEAIAAFLNHILASDEFEYFHKKGADALRKYWTPDEATI